MTTLAAELGLHVGPLTPDVRASLRRAAEAEAARVELEPRHLTGLERAAIERGAELAAVAREGAP